MFGALFLAATHCRGARASPGAPEPTRLPLQPTCLPLGTHLRKSPCSTARIPEAASTMSGTWHLIADGAKS